MNNANNQNKKSEQEIQANKILYITVAAMLVIMALVIVLSSVLSKAKPSSDTESSTDTVLAPSYTNPTETKPSSPSVTLPVAAEPEDTDEVLSPEPQAPTVPTLALPLENGILSKEYSDKMLVYSTTMEDYRTHMGIDINASLGSPVLAAADGTVVDIYNDAMTGRCIKIEHDGGLSSIYRNLSDTAAEGLAVGNKVKCGEVIGYVGESSMIEIAQEPHLHFEATLNGKYVNPEDYLSSNAKSELLQDTSYES